MRNTLLPILLIAAAHAALADSSTLDAALGGGLGGAAGAAIGNELGGREGAILGGAIGGAAGAAVATESAGTKAAPKVPRSEVHHHRHPARQPYYHCPPGQAKKGRC